MEPQIFLKKIMFVAVVCFFTTAALGVAGAMAHCDTENGPVAVDARKALSNDNYKTVAIWVGEKQREELRSAFDRAIAVYRMGGKTKKLAELYFMETAVRLHREAEGMSYTGLKPARPLPEDIAEAETALKTGDLKPVTGMLAAEMEKQLEHVFKKARTAGQDKDKSLEAGREWADAYVKYVIYIHGLYKAIQAGPAHGVGE